MKKLALIFISSIGIIFICNAQNSQVINWLKSNAIPLENGKEIVSIDTSINNMPIKFKNAQVYGFGEASHQHKEFSNLKSSFIKYLVLNNNVKNIFIEESFGATYSVNQYLKNGEGNIKNLLKDFRQGMFQTQEFLNLIIWMRQYNSEKLEENQIQIYGIDSMFNYNIIKVLKNLIENNNFHVNTEETEILNQYSEEKFQPFKVENLTAEISILSNLSEKIQVEKEFGDKTTARAAIHSLQNYLLFMDTSKQSVRDENMSKFIIDVLIKASKFQKGFVWSHNLHIQKEFLPDVNLTGATLFPKDTPSLGNLLKKKYGEKYYAVGFDFGTGTLESIDRKGNWQSGELKEPPSGTFSEILHKAPYDIFYFDIDSAKDDKFMNEFISTKRKYLNVGGNGILPKYVKSALSKGNLSDLYDGLIYIDNVSLSSEIEK